MPTSTAADLHDHLQLLQQERVLALGTSLAHDAAYMADLEEEIVATRHAYVGSVVVEVARLRASVSGELRG